MQPQPHPLQQGVSAGWPPPGYPSTTAGPSTITFDPAMQPQPGTPADQPMFTPPPPVDGLGDPAAAYSDSGGGPPPAAPAASPVEDTATVLAQPTTITLLSGRRVYIKRLKTRELLALVGIGVGGIGGQIGKLNLDMEDSAEVFMAKFAGLLLAAFPHAQDEVMAFLRLVCEPVGKVTEGKIDKAVKARNDALEQALDAELENPDFDDTISIIEAIAAQEGGSLQAWGKRLAGIWNLASRTGQIPASRTSQA